MSAFAFCVNTCERNKYPKLHNESSQTQSRAKSMCYLNAREGQFGQSVNLLWLGSQSPLSNWRKNSVITYHYPAVPMQ